MFSILKYTAVFGAGVYVGIYLSKRYAKDQVHGGLHDLLSKVGLAGGDVEAELTKLVDSKVLNE